MDFNIAARARARPVPNPHSLYIYIYTYGIILHGNSAGTSTLFHIRCPPIYSFDTFD